MTIRIENGIYDENIINRIVKCLVNGGIIIMPSDTIYGFLCIPSVESKLRGIKNRDEKPFIHLIDDFDKLDFFDIKYNSCRDLLSRNWPGPYTFLLKNQDGRIFGIRMPDWDILSIIIKKCGIPLLSTSVNLSGNPALNEIDKIINLFGNKADLIINDPDFKNGTASTIVDLSESEIKIIRQGSFSLK